MTDLGETAQTPAKPVRQSKRAHALAIIGLVLIVVSGPVAKAGLMSPMAGMLGYTIASLLMLIAMIIALRALLGNSKSPALNSTVSTWLVLVAGAAVLIVNINTIAGSSGAPAIHDVSTDLANPPEFVEIVALREAAEAPNPPGYLDDGSAQLQAEAFPEIKTIRVNSSYQDVFDKAVSATERMGWELVAAEAAEGRIEAVASTGYVGFKDDVVIRIKDEGTSVAVDIRSKSRMGKGDMGANAARIRSWSKLLNE